MSLYFFYEDAEVSRKQWQSVSADHEMIKAGDKATKREEGGREGGRPAGEGYCNRIRLVYSISQSTLLWT